MRSAAEAEGVGATDASQALSQVPHATPNATASVTAQTSVDASDGDL